MNDGSQGAAAGNGAAEAEGALAPPLLIGAQYVKDLSFENPLGAEAVSALPDSPNVQIDVNASARPLDDDSFEVSLFIRGEAKAGDRTVFIVELTYAGIVAVNRQEVPEENLHPLVMIEGPRHLFPFARAVVANTTRDGGFPPLMIGPIDFAALYFERHRGEDDEAGEE